jgi:hypothetical protein
MSILAPTPYVPGQIRTMYEMYQGGMTLREVGKRYGFGRSWVGRTFAQYGLPRRPTSVVPKPRPEPEPRPEVDFTPAAATDTSRARDNAEYGSERLLLAITKYNDREHPGWRV